MSACTRWATALLLGAVAQAARPAGADDRVDVQPHWHVGDHPTYRVTETTVATLDGGSKALGSSQVTIALDVVEARDGGWIVVWRPVPPPVTTSAASDDERVVREAKALPMTLRIDTHGRLLEVVNREQVRDAANRVAEVMRRFMLARKATPQMIAIAMDHEHARVADEAAVRASLGYEAQVLLASLGHAYDRAVPSELTRDAPNPMGGPAVPATLRFELDPFDRGAGIASLRVTQRTDPAVPERTLRAVTDGITRSAGSSAPAGAEPTVGDVAVTYRATVDVATGWPRMARSDIAATFKGVPTLQSTLLERQ